MKENLPCAGRLKQAHDSQQCRFSCSVRANDNDDFTGISVDWPFAPMQRPFGTFSTFGAIRPGTAAIVEISGTQAEKQLIELKANGIGAAAPAELRLAIVRVQ